MFNIFSTLKNNASQAIGGAMSAASNVADTVSKNIQDFGGDVYHAYSGTKQEASNAINKGISGAQDIYSTVNKNLYNFGGDVYDTYSGAKTAVSKAGGQIYDNTLGKAYNSFGKFATEVGDIGKEREATKVGLTDDEMRAIMKQMRTEGYSDDDIINQMTNLDEQLKSEKQQAFAQKYSGEGASAGQRALAGGINFGGGVIAGGMRLPAGVTDFVTGGNPYSRDTLGAINEFTSGSNAAKAGDIFGQIAVTSAIPGVGRVLPKGTGLGASIGRGSILGGGFGALTPIMEKGSEATISDIGAAGATGAALGAIGGPILERGAPALIRGAQSGIKAAQYTNGNVSQKAGEGLKATGKSIIRPISRSKAETSATVNKTIQSILSGRSAQTKELLAKSYGLENQEIGALRKVGSEKVDKILTRMSELDKKALKGGGVGNIYDDLHKEIMSGVQKRSNELSKLEKGKLDLISKAEGSVSRKELDDIFDEVIGSQGIKRVKGGYEIVGEGDITRSDLSKLSSLYKELVRGGKDVSLADMNARIKNLQKNLYNKDGSPVYGSESLSRTAQRIVARSNEVLKSKLPKEYSLIKDKQSKIINQRRDILKALKEEDNSLATLTDEQLLSMSEKDIFNLINDSIAGNRMALFLRRLANSTTTGGDAKQLANNIKNFTGLDVENNAIALRAVARLTGNQQIFNELGGLIEKGIARGAANLVRKAVAPSPEKILKATAEKKSVIKKKQPATKTKSKSSQKESPFKNKKGFINPSEIKKSLIPKKGIDEAKQFYDDLVYAGNSPIVAQRETAKRFGTIRAMSASKAGTFGGEGAKEAPKTGWFKGADGKMRFEIDDSGAKFVENARVNKNGKALLGDILRHDDLYEQYPELKSITVKFNDTYEKGGGSYNPSTRTLEVNGLNLDPRNGEFLGGSKEAKSTLLHEIQHAIQEKEGFARGGNPESFKQGIEYYKKLADYNRDILGDIRYDKMLEKDKTSIAYKKLVKEEEEALRTYKIANEKYKELSSTSPMESYNNQAGEVESRNVQTRMNMTAKERALKSPESTEDVPRNKQIVRFKNDGTSMSIDKAGTMEIPEELVQEARKYKSAEEFVNSKTNAFHGTKKSFLEFEQDKIGSGNGTNQFGEGIYLTNNKRVADSYAGGAYGGPGETMRVAITGNILKLNDKIPDKAISELKQEFPRYDLKGKTFKDFYDILELDQPGNIVPKKIQSFNNIIKRHGVDGFEFKRENSIQTVVFNAKAVQTEGKLKQIYEQANTKK